MAIRSCRIGEEGASRRLCRATLRICARLALGRHEPDGPRETDPGDADEGLASPGPGEMGKARARHHGAAEIGRR